MSKSSFFIFVALYYLLLSDCKAQTEDVVANVTSQVLWIRRSYEAVDFGLNLTVAHFCSEWETYWNANDSLKEPTIMLVPVENGKIINGTAETEEIIIPAELSPPTTSVVAMNTSIELEEVGLDPALLNQYTHVKILTEEVCGKWPRIYWVNDSTTAEQIGFDQDNVACEPFKESLELDIDDLTSLTDTLTEQSENATSNATTNHISSNITDDLLVRIKRQIEESEAKSKEENVVDSPETTANVTDEELAELKALSSNETESQEVKFEITQTEGRDPILIIDNEKTAETLYGNGDPDLWKRYEKVAFNLKGVCGSITPETIKKEEISVDVDENVGVDTDLLRVNKTELAEQLRNDTALDEILRRAENEEGRALGGSYILPILKDQEYDPFSPPVFFEGQTVVIKISVYIESLSNFETTTMDYDMDIYLRMAWRDARLNHNYSQPILVKEEELLYRIWRPDPYFANAKEAQFHDVTFLNFLMKIYPTGEVLYETRIKLKPSCNLVLCKFPHDEQICSLLVKSFAYSIDLVRFEWFSDKNDALSKNPKVQLPELYISDIDNQLCDGSRATGALVASVYGFFYLKRDIGFHVAQTYIPTSLALMFSWVGVWLPEEFMEGRIGVAITVLLTMSTESAGAREHLPSVSYLKAIDIWFGFVTGFVFFTLLQTLFVIGFDKRAQNLRKWAAKKKTGASEEVREAMFKKAARFHKAGRTLDNFCRVFYPLSFVIFLILYFFVFTTGQQNSCISKR